MCFWLKIWILQPAVDRVLCRCSSRFLYSTWLRDLIVPSGTDCMVHGFWGCCLVTVAVRATAPDTLRSAAQRCAALPGLELACTEDAGECSWKPQSAHGPAQDLPTLLWMAPMLNPGGFSSEALSYAEALQKAYEAHGHAGRFGVRQFAEQMRRVLSWMVR
eukprot:Skav224623  [mRNA]  locus=scaffold2059:103133:111591:- [translate_table: standard]